MYCEKCGAEVAENEKFCRECGAPIAEKSSTLQKVPEQQETQQKESKAPEQKKEKAERKSGKSKLPFIIAAVVVVLLVVVGFASRSALANTFKKMSSPEKYYRWVEEQEIQKLTETASNMYGNYLLSALGSHSQSATTKLNIAFGEEMEDWLDMLDAVGVDLTWFTNGSLVWSHNLKNNILEEEIGLEISDKDIISAKAIFDLNEEMMYAGVPTLTNTYISADASEFMDDDDMEAIVSGLELMKKLEKAIPDSAKVNKIMNKYVSLVLEKVEDVELSKNKKLRAGDVTQECTLLEVTLEEELLYEAMETIFEQLQEDEDVKEIILDICKVLEEADDFDFDMDAEDVYDEFVEFCEDTADEIAEEKEYAGDEELIMNVYVDGSGTVVGREFIMEYEYYDGTTEEECLALKMPRDGKKFGFELSATDGNETVFALEGNGTLSGGKLSGEFELEVEGMKLIEFNLDKFDFDALRDGYINGTFSMGLHDGLTSLVNAYFENSYWWYDDYTESSDYKMAMSVISKLKDMSFEVTVNTDDSESSVKLALVEDEKNVCSITISGETGSGKKVSVPSAKKTIEVEDEDDLADWWDTLTWDKFIEKLDDAGMPSDWVDMLEELSEADLEDIF